MHILFLTDNFPPETNAPASRTFEHARDWVSAGHQVTVITCAPNFPHGKVFSGYRNKLWQEEEMAGIRVIRVWSYMTGNEGFSRRILDYMSYMITGFFAALFVRRPDIVIGTSPQFFTVVAAWAAAAIKHKPFVFELRDIWPESIRAVGALQESHVLNMLEKLELFLYRRATAVIAVTNSFRRNLITRGIAGDKIHVVTNGIDTSRFRPMPQDTTLAADLGVEGCFVAGYIGTHGMSQALDTLLDAAALLQDDAEAADIRILFLGNGAARHELMTRAAGMGLTNVIFCESVPKDEVPRYWSLLDVSLIHLRRTELFTTVIPSKMFECMGMGVPILMGVEGEAADILRDTEAGQTFEPQNPQALTHALKRLYQDAPERDRLSLNGITRSRNYDRSKLARDMLAILEQLT